MWAKRQVHIPALDLKRKYKVCNFGLKRSSGRSNEGEMSAGLLRKGRDLLVTQADFSVLRVFSSAVALLKKKSPRQRRKMCANSLWLYSYYTQSSPSKNKNIKYIFTYLRVFRCLSSSSIYKDRCLEFEYECMVTVTRTLMERGTVTQPFWFDLIA